MRHRGPGLLGGRAQQFEYLIQLVVRVPDTGERWHSRHHLHEYAAHSPHVQWRRVLGAAQEHVYGREAKQRKRGETEIRGMNLARELESGNQRKTHLVVDTRASPPRWNTYGWAHSSRGPVRSRPVSIRQHHWSAGSGVSRPGATHVACGSTRGRAAIEIGTVARFYDPGRPDVVPCTGTGQCSCGEGDNRHGYWHGWGDVAGAPKILTTYSNTKVSVSRVWTMSCNVTMFECFNSLSRDASRIAVNGAPSSSWSLISFNATTWCVKLDR